MQVCVCLLAAVAVFFQSAVYNTSEGLAALLVLVADREFTVPLTVDLATHSGSAVQDLDFGGTNQLVTLDVASQSAQVPVQALRDDLCEGAEQFTAALSLPQHTAPPNMVIGSPSVATVSIEDLTGQYRGMCVHVCVCVHVPAASLHTGVCVSFASAADTVAEGDATNLTLTLDKTCPYSLHVNITVVDGTAVAPQDYTGGHYSLWFDPGSQTATLKVRTNADNVLEMSESFVAMVTSDPAQVALCDPTSSTVTIEDGTRAEVFFSPPEYGVKEGDTVTLTLELTAEVASGVALRVSVMVVNGTAHSEQNTLAGGRGEWWVSVLCWSVSYIRPFRLCG